MLVDTYKKGITEFDYGMSLQNRVLIEMQQTPSFIMYVQNIIGIDCYMRLRKFYTRDFYYWYGMVRCRSNGIKMEICCHVALTHIHTQMVHNFSHVYI